MKWAKPTEVPDLRGVRVMVIDTETYDPDLKTKGPGFITRGSYPIGISIATDTGICEYYPIAHKTDNVEFNIVGFLQEQLQRPDLIIVGANTKYDLESLWKAGIVPTCHIDDIQVTEALIDENQTSYSLSSIAKRRKLGDKSNAEMEKWMIEHGMIAKGQADYSRLRDCPPWVVGPYAKDDARLTLSIWQQQQADIVRDEIQQVAALESRLIPVLFKMRLRGVRIDYAKAEELNVNLGLQLEDQFRAIDGASKVDPFSSKSLSDWVKARGFTPPETVKGNDSVSNDWLLASGDEALVQMAKYRQGEKIRRDFIQSMILEGSYNGRLHPNWFQTRGSSFMSGDDVNGTRSGRIACTDPNLTQIPSRHPTYGPMVRGLFIPEDGERWLKTDYQAQEIRIGVHYANKLNLSGAAKIAQAYRDNPMLDYHEMVKEMVNAILSSPITRNTAKTTNLSLAYGMGKRKLAGRLGFTTSETEQFLNVYHREIPFVKEALDTAMRIANDRGYVKTIMGRRRHFSDWENANWGSAWERPIKDKQTALLTWGKIKRAGTYKAWNSIIQGTAAEQTKNSIVNMADEGIYPLMQVYDELDFSVSHVAEAYRVRQIMEHAIQMTVPVVAEMWTASDWSGLNKEKL
jgi:DNA polymerase I-like protein with 3'-5' exonuclease and polymerase domains